VQRTSRARLPNQLSPWFRLLGYNLFCVLAVTGYMMGITQSKEYAEPQWYADIWLVVIWVVYFLVYLCTRERSRGGHSAPAGLRPATGSSRRVRTRGRACACDRCIAAADRKLGATKEEIAKAPSAGISVNTEPPLVYSPERLTHSISMRQLDIIYSGGRSCVIDPIYAARHGPP
jgi:hypothetical protein